jgi:hypothetical protein
MEGGGAQTQPTAGRAEASGQVRARARLRAGPGLSHHSTVGNINPVCTFRLLLRYCHQDPAETKKPFMSVAEPQGSQCGSD